MKAQETKERTVDRDKVEELRQDSDFIYSTDYKIEEDPLERIWNWLTGKFFQLIGKATEDGPVRIVFLILIALVLVYGVLKLIGIDTSINLLHRNRETRYDGRGGVIEDVIGKDFKSEIEKAYQTGDYKEVIRNYYLFALDRMDGAGIIKWKKGKTNYEYLDEVKDPQLRIDFSALDNYFVYAVYGEFDVNQSLANEAGSLFEKINAAIK